MEKYFEIGHISNTHGLKGEMKVESYSKDAKLFEKLKKILIDIKGELKEYEIENVRYQKEIVLLKLKDVDSIEQAERLKNFYIKISRENIDKPEEDEYFIADLIGLDVYENNNFIGKVDDIFTSGGSDVYVVKREKKKDLFLPAIASVIKNIDINSKKIEVEIPRGIDDEV